MSENGELSFKIGLLGPARAGKTSIVATMLDAGQQLLVGTPVTMRPGNSETEVQISRIKRELQGSLLAEEFKPDSVRSTHVDVREYSLRIDPGVPGAGVRFDLLDFPGEWLDPTARGRLHQEKWEACRRFITQSTVLIIPADAAVLMEVELKEHQRAWPFIFAIDEIAQVAGDWAAERNMKPDEPCLLLFCPVKCESYFADNGGRTDSSRELFNRFTDVYDDVLSRVQKEAPKARSLYCPVDTLGCVELSHAEWVPDQEGRGGGWSFNPTFALRPDALGRAPKIRPKGVDDILVSLCNQFLTARRLMDEKIAEQQRQKRTEAENLADRSEGLFNDMWLWISRERARRRRAVEEIGMTEAEIRHRVEALEKILNDIASRPRNSRVRDL